MHTVALSHTLFITGLSPCDGCLYNWHPCIAEWREFMPESVLASIQRQQIEITIGELLLTSDHYMRQEIAERLRHLIAHADPTLDKSQLSELAIEELQELNLLPQE
jgi:hypothetical protein